MNDTTSEIPQPITENDRWRWLYQKVTRVEIEFKHDWAENFIKVIANVEESIWIEQCIGLLCDYVDFVDRSDNCDIHEAPRLPWWQSFVGNADTIGIGVSKSAEGPLLTKTRAWFVRMIPMLYLVRHGLGISVDAEVDKSEWRLTNRHIRKLELLRKLVQCEKSTLGKTE